MKLGVKLAGGYLAIVLLMGFVGLGSIISFSSIAKSNKMASDLTMQVNLLSDLRLNVVKLSASTTLGDYGELLNRVYDLREDFRLAHEESEWFIHSIKGFERFDSDVNDFTRVSDDIISLHTERLSLEKVFSEKAAAEKSIRYDIRAPLFAMNDSKLTELVGFMQYYSKEALYQYRDEEHLNEWLQSIDDVESALSGRNFGVSDSNVNSGVSDLLHDLGSYKAIASEMGGIALRLKDIEAKEASNVGVLRGVTARMEESRKLVSNRIDFSVESESRNTSGLMIVVTLVGVILSLAMGYFVSSSISRQIGKLKSSADEIGKGNFDAYVDLGGDDEIRDLATQLDLMRYNLMLTVDSIKEKAAKEKKEK